MAKSLFESAHEIKKNCRITIYPDGSVGEILACSVDIFVPDGWEAVNQIIGVVLFREKKRKGGREERNHQYK